MFIHRYRFRDFLITFYNFILLRKILYIYMRYSLKLQLLGFFTV